MHEVLVNCLGGLSLLRKSVVRLTDRPDMTLDVCCRRKTTTTTTTTEYLGNNKFFKLKIHLNALGPVGLNIILFMINYMLVHICKSADYKIWAKLKASLA